MSNPASSRFAAQNQTTHERLSTTTVGLVALSDFRKRRAEVLEQQEREAREAALSGPGAGSAIPTPDRSLTGTPNNLSDHNAEPDRQATKKRKQRRALVSFEGGEGDGDVDDTTVELTKSAKARRTRAVESARPTSGGNFDKGDRASNLAANTSIAIAPRSLTKAALLREAAERDALRREFLTLQTAVKATEFAIPFVFYDGTNIPGGVVRVKKGDFVWVFLDKSRKVGADLGVGGNKNVNVRREWARAGVDDLMLVRGTVIIPHHYEFYFFIMNKTAGPGGRRLFNYHAEAPSASETSTVQTAEAVNMLSKSPKSQGLSKEVTAIGNLEGVSDDPAFTKVVARRWYERNKHIYPASVWQEFDPEKNYQSEIRRDLGGNAFFYSN